MVKADSKHDYYADLELPPTADSETIKKQFRLLAKQYHPDRNPGREIECIPKFQAIQAAHEILSDPTQKSSYDRDRANQSYKVDSTGTNTFRKPAKPPPPPSNFPPPPKRNSQAPKSTFGQGVPPPTSSASAERFARFARQAPQPQQWDRARFEDAAKAETLRNLNNMRGQSSGVPPRVPPRAAPTAPKPSPGAPSPDPSQTSGTNPGFPGLSRTNSGRRGGFAPGNPNTDEPPASTSAYSRVHRPPPAAAGYSYPPNSRNSTPSAQATEKSRPSMSPLRPSKSSGFESAARPDLSRTSSRYAAHSGEKTNINGPGLSRSSSVRNSPISPQWDESGPFGRRPQSQQQGGSRVPPPRHHSSSPPRGRSTQFEFSASESSSDDDRQPSPAETRPKATPRRSQPPPSNQTPNFMNNDTGTYRFGNYTSPENKQYHYPPPETNGTPYRRNFPEPSNPIDDITQGLNNSGIRHVHRDDVPFRKYATLSSYCSDYLPWMHTAHKRAKLDPLINGVPIWALPASLYPTKPPVKDIGSCVCPPSKAPGNGFPNKSFEHCPVHSANRCLSSSSQHPNGTTSNQQPTVPATNTSFSAAAWDGKFADGNAFRPTESQSRSRSPTKPGRPKLPSRNQGVSRSQGEKESDGSANEEGMPTMPGVRHVVGTQEGGNKATAFQPGKFSAEDWAQRLRSQSNGFPPKVPPREKPVTPNLPTQQPTVHDEVKDNQNSRENGAQQPQKAAEPDAMDVDESVPQPPPNIVSPTPKRPTSNTAHQRANSGVDLSELKNTVPFKPSATGLGDLDDLGNSLPFESRAAEELNLHQAPSSGLAAHHLRLPAPPKTVLPPDEDHLDQDTWSAYAAKMTQYMDAWNIFNCKMIDHFRVRQQQIHLAMYHNWITAIGDGAAADDFDGVDFIGPDSTSVDGSPAARSKSKKAGYSTYMEWLKQDRVCRTWWEVAFDEHSKCMEDLGRVRKLVKTIFVRETRKPSQ